MGKENGDTRRLSVRAFDSDKVLASLKEMGIEIISSAEFGEKVSASFPEMKEMLGFFAKGPFPERLFYAVRGKEIDVLAKSLNPFVCAIKALFVFFPREMND